MKPTRGEVRAAIERLLLGVLVVAAIFAFATPLAAKKKQAQSFAVIEGTVFQKSGFLLRGARITVTPQPEKGSKVSSEEIRTVETDARGEFVVRVPAGSMRYTIEVEADGWQPARKSVDVQWDQRVSVSFRLQPATDEGKSQ